MKIKVRDFLAIVSNCDVWDIRVRSIVFANIEYRNERGLSTQEVLEKYGDTYIVDKIGGVELSFDVDENPVLCIGYETI